MSDDEKSPPMDSQDPWLSDSAGPETPRSGRERTDGDPQQKENGWEREVMSKLVFSTLQEQRRSRRWGIFFKLLLFIYLFILLWMFYTPPEWQEVGIAAGRHTALVDLEGTIAQDSKANADDLVTALRAAFKNKGTAGVILRANSPGGSPVQAGYVNDEIGRLREKYPDIPLYVVITDICASGCYYIAAAGDKIYADKASVVGSIGVLMNGFGFVDTMEKLGVERRLFTAGENKDFLDPFSPLEEDDKQHIKEILGNIHRQFINVVKAGRGDRLADSDQLFSGLMWTGEQSIELGLVDELGSTGFVAREIIGADKIVDYTKRPDYFERFAERFGASMGDSLGSLLGTVNIK